MLPVERVLYFCPVKTSAHMLTKHGRLAPSSCKWVGMANSTNINN